MIKPKQPFFKVKNPGLPRKPSLPIRRSSSVQSQLSNNSCMSERIIYHKHSIQQLTSERKLTEVKFEESINKNERERERKKKASSKGIVKKQLTKQQHWLTTFQWLLIMRHLFHLENKKRSSTNIKQRTLLNYVKNKMYPDSIWNKVLVISNENKYTTEEICQIIQKYSKTKLSLDDLYHCLSKLYDKESKQSAEQQSPIETARFVDQIKAMEDPQSQNKNMNCKKHKHKEIKIQTISKNQFDPIMEDISPISRNNQTNNDISFSMEYDSHQSQFSQVSLETKFDSALTALQKLARKVGNCQFLKQLMNYSIYMFKSNRTQPQSQYIYGLKLVQTASLDNLKYLQTMVTHIEVVEYFSFLQGLKINFYHKYIPYVTPLLSENIKILNLSHNNLRGVSFLKDYKKYSQLQFININHNKINNVSDLISLPKLQQLHAKHNNIDHISISSKFKGESQLTLIDLSWNQIQKEEDLWSLRNLPSLKMINLAGNQIMRGHKWMGLLKKELILNYQDLYIFSQYTEYKDIAFSENKQNIES